MSPNLFIGTLKPHTRILLIESSNGRLPQGLAEKPLELADFLLNNAHVAVVPGSAFGAPGYLRLSYALEETLLEKALLQLKTTLMNAMPLT